jgi:cell division protein FtsZ
MEVASNPPIVEIPAVNSKTTVDKSSESVVHFTLSSESNSIAAEANQQPLKKAEPKTVNHQSNKNKKEASTAPTSGGYLAKPSQIYVEAKPNPESKSVEEPTTPMSFSKQEDEPVIGMQLVVKNSHEAAEEKEEPKVHQTMPIMMPSVEELPQVDETGDLKRRAMERIAKLRNLSFNVNAADPNNEFESVPAYLRRNMELHNSIADVESFYSNYIVKSDENNKAEISTINTFLEGKKPD